MSRAGWREHGTAVLGEVVGKDNGRGVVGIAPEVDRVVTASIDGPGVAGAIEAAAEALRPGDVLLIPAGEKHMTANTGSEPLVLLCFFPVADVTSGTNEFASF
jgi:oxalate decarboxylase/phosphoglucose isomerase-like protein (cupin superfamily)